LAEPGDKMVIASLISKGRAFEVFLCAKSAFAEEMALYKERMA
jgi:hypothetical protein